MKQRKHNSSITAFLAKFKFFKEYQRGMSTFGVAVLLALTVPTGPVIDQMSTLNGGPPAFYAGRNVNMVADDILLQRQNEPSIAVSTDNPDFLLAGANDYRTVDMPGTPGETITGDAWLGVFKSFDGGDSWQSELLPGYSSLHPSPLFGYDAAADPTVTAGIDGKFFYSGIAFDRIENGDSVIFMARFQDTGSDIVYQDTKIIDSGTSGQFSDKPWNAVDVPRPGYPDGIAYIIYSVFLGSSDPNNNIHSKILISRSIDGGETWSKPTKVSEGEQKNQGTVVYIDPSDGTVYVAWRRFASSNAMDAILIARSEDFGQTFTKAEEVWNIARPFDQSTIGGALPDDPAQFRTNAFPALAVDHSGRVYVSWSQRDVDPAYPDDARIVITSQPKAAWGSPWPAPEAVDKPDGYSSQITFPGSPGDILHSHQFMPTLTYGSGRLMIAWFDNRYSARIVNEYGELRSPAPCPYGETVPVPGPDRIMDYNPECAIRETIDVRAAMALPTMGDYPSFGDSIQVSRYIWVLEDTGNPSVPYRPVQGQFNPPNYKLFSGGTMPFHGDYLDITTAPLMVKSGGTWRFSDVGDPLVYYVTWTDNRDVLPPDTNIWTDYTPPAYDPNCAGFDSGMRNQNVYVSKLAQGIETSVQGNFEQDGQQVFVITLQNETGSPLEDPNLEPQFKSFTLHIAEAPGAASFYPGPPPQGADALTIDVDVPDHSTVSRMVFVSNSNASPIEVQISEFDTGTFTDTLYLSPESSAALMGGTTIAEMETIDWTDPPYNPTTSLGEKLLANPNILTPNILTPNILTPNILTPNILTPNILTPNILTPNILTPNILTPNILTPNILTPNILTMSILNPNILTPNILTTPPPDGTQVVDKIWNVTNNTNAVSSFTFKSIAGDTLPSGVVGMQLLIFKVHKTPSTDGCTLKDQVQHELLVNITNPIIVDYIDLNNLNQILGDPNVEFENATFCLGPYEEALVTLRVIDINPQKAGVASKGLTVAEDPDDPTTSEEYADNLGAVVVSHTSTEDTPQSAYNALTLQILPSGLADGWAGSLYPEQRVIAIGGAGDYTWSIIAGSLPPGLDYSIEDDPNDDPDFGNIFIISGTPLQSGAFAFTLQVASNGDMDTQRFSIDIAAPKTPLTVTMNPDPAPAATRNVDYELNQNPQNPAYLTFTASGGVPHTSGSNLYDWADSNLPPGLALVPVSGAPGAEYMHLRGTPTQAGNYTITIGVNDAYLTDTGRPVTLIFNLCVLPAEPFTVAPLENGAPINCASGQACELPAGGLGDAYDDLNVTLTAQNREPGTMLDWELVSGSLPPGLAFNPPLPASGSVPADYLEVLGTPTFDGDFNYPKAYGPIKVRVTETYNFGGTCTGSRAAEIDLSLTVDPKTGAWAFRETGYEGTASDLTMDGLGHVYVTGAITDPASGANFYTMKFNAEGNPAWPAPMTYNGPGNGSDVPSVITVDSTGVYVTGGSEGANTGQDIYTVKYGLNDGHIIWESRYDGPSHLGDGVNDMMLQDPYLYLFAYEHRGNVTKHADSLVIKLDLQTGEEEWAESYDSSRNGNDIAMTGAVDAFGNVYSAIKSQPSDKKVQNSHDFLILKYNSSGRLQWEYRDDGPGFGDDEPIDMALWQDGGGNVFVYVTGSTGAGVGDAVSKDYYTIKLDAGGNRLWNMPYTGAGNGNDTAHSIAVDGMGNAYVTGRSLGTSGDVFATVKYDSGGSFGWEKTGFETMAGDDAGVSIAFDSGQLLAAGFISTPDGGTDFLILNLDPSDGSILWLARHPLPADLDQGDEFVTAMSLDTGAVYVTGYSLQGGTNHMLTVKFNR